MVIKIVATKDQWQKFVERSSAGKCELFEVVTMKVDDKAKKIEVKETSKCGTSRIEVAWVPQSIKGAGKITISTGRFAKALGAIGDATPITATFDEGHVILEGTGRWIKFGLPEVSTEDAPAFPALKDHIIDIEADADILVKGMTSSVSAIECDPVMYTLMYKSGVVSMKVGDFEKTGGEVIIPVASSLAKKTDVETFESCHNHFLRDMLGMGGKVRLSIGDKYPLKIVVDDKILGSTYYIAPTAGIIE
jgi:hypothetical protein